MTTKTDTEALDTCGCCETGPPPREIVNPPGQPALAYRLGSHGDFLARMLARLSIQTIDDGPHQDSRPLAELTTRDRDDPAVALLDGWAVIADILSFYQERIAAEGYLRTATERRSVLELARSIGYELNPGVAASTYLCFTVEEAPGAPLEAVVPAGTRVQSLPAPGKLPQTFETAAAITARGVWNALRPRLTRPQELALMGGKLYLLGLSSRFPEGAAGLVTITPADFAQVFPLNPEIVLDPALGEIQALEVQHLYLQGTTAPVKAGDLLLLVGKSSSGGLKTASLPIHRVTPEAAAQRTRLDLVEMPAAVPFAPATRPLASLALMAVEFSRNQVETMILGQSWRETDLSPAFKMWGWTALEVVQTAQAAPAPVLPPSDQGVFGFRQRLGFFGHNAPLFGSLPDGDNLKADPYAAEGSNWDTANGGTGRTIWTDSWGNLYPTRYPQVDVFLERSLPEMVTNSWIVCRDPGVGPVAYRVAAVSEISVVGYGLSAKATGLQLTAPDGVSPPDKTVALKVRRTTAHAQSERLELAPLPIDDPLPAGSTELMLDGLFPGLQSGQPVALTGELEAAPGVTQTEILILADVWHVGGFTTLTFTGGLAQSYLRRTVTLNANVVLATHGEAVAEVLGSGDGSRVRQRFVLKKPPLTYVSAATPSGGKSTLTVRVNGVAWEEAAYLYGLPGESQSYMVRRQDDGSTEVSFGDGQEGARLPTGPENVTAAYRSGIGPEGEVAAGSLTLLQTRPLGIRGVINPLAASGAAAPESRDQARDNAPLTVLTMDRIVSLQDYEDFARGFGGIGKARALVLWNGENRLVHLTVATASGQPVDYASELYDNLVEAVDAVRNPGQQFRVDSFQPRFFNVTAKLELDGRYLPDAVISRATAALISAFGFAARNFGQAVTAAEVVTVLQGTDGVVAVDLDQLYQATDPDGPAQTTPPAVLPAQPARLGTAQEVLPAELLLINAAGIALTERKT